MEIRDYKCGDEEAILDLFEVVFRKRMSLNYWKWRFLDNPAGKTCIKLMWQDDQLVGHYAVSPVSFKSGDDCFLSALSMSTMTHPDYGGRGIFTSLASSLYDYLHRDRGVELVWGFPNGNSHYGFIKNLRWSDIAVVHTLFKNISNIKPLICENIRITEKFTNAHASVLKDVTAGFKFKVERNVEYLNWRYTHNPSNEYLIFEYNLGGNVQFLVTKLYPSPIDKNKSDIFIMEYGLLSHDLLNDFIQHLASHYIGLIENIAIWCNIHDSKHIQLEKMGFLFQGKQTILSAISLDPKYQEVFDNRNWYYTFGDSDVY
jgi:hypothetical protein